MTSEAFAEHAVAESLQRLLRPRNYFIAIEQGLTTGGVDGHRQVMDFLVDRQLVIRGVKFDRDPDEALSLALEGGHSRRRVVHAGGAATGRRITERLTELAAENEGVELIEKTSAVGLSFLRSTIHFAVAVYSRSFHVAFVVEPRGGSWSIPACTRKNGRGNRRSII